MIYKVIKDDKEYEIDDTVFFDAQPKDFQVVFNELKQGDMAEFDNCICLILPTNRVIISAKEVQDGE